MNDAEKTPDPPDPVKSPTTSQLFPLLYEDLRNAARAQMAGERLGQTLQATALVHEAYLRLSKSEKQPQWNGPAHFFAAVTEVMRRILVENARRKKRVKRGGRLNRQQIDPNVIRAPDVDEDVLLLDEALEQLANHNQKWVELVKLRFFIGMTIPEAARVLGVSPRTADSWWADTRAWLREKLALDIDGILS
jgi:RNA polymerase sigma factor (TIGR02999 family)